MELSGFCKDGFEPVRDAFVANFERGVEVGASVAVTHDGEPVVDLWAGDADPHGTPWAKDTIVCVFSCETPTQPTRYSQQAGSSIAFSVPSLDVAVAELRAKGVRFLHSTPNEGPSGRYVAFVDPFGTVHELAQAHG